MAVTLPPDFRLEEIERTSGVWQKVKAYLEHRLRLARMANDGPLDVIATATLRGEIAALKSLLALENERPPRK